MKRKQKESLLDECLGREYDLVIHRKTKVGTPKFFKGAKRGLYFPEIELVFHLEEKEQFCFPFILSCDACNH